MIIFSIILNWKKTNVYSNIKTAAGGPIRACGGPGKTPIGGPTGGPAIKPMGGPTEGPTGTGGPDIPIGGLKIIK